MFSDAQSDVPYFYHCVEKQWAVEPTGAEHEVSQYTTAWPSHEKEKPVPAPTAGSECTLRFVDRGSVTAQMNSQW